MGKNKKQQAAYDYNHDNANVKGNILWSIRRKWWRHNWDVGEFRFLKKKKQEEILEKK